MNWEQFYPGRRVVSLIDWKARLAPKPGFARIHFDTLPVKGEICTIQSTRLSLDQELILFLAEHKPGHAVLFRSSNPVVMLLGFDAMYFRPLDESKLDQFRVHLQGVPVEAPEGVPA